MKKSLSSLILCISVLTGCTSFNQYRNMQKPIASLDTIEVKDVSSKGAQLLFKLEVENPNDFPLKVDSVKYQIDIGGRTISTDAITTPTEVGAKTKSLVQLPLTLQFADIFSSIGDFLRKEKTVYRLKGNARVGIFTLPFDETGEFQLLEGEIKHVK